MFLEFKKEAEQVLKEALEKASYGYKDLSLDLELDESEHADLSSRIAFSLANAQKKAPAIIAAEIVKQLELPAAEDTLIAKAVAAGPYINFFVNDSFLAKTLAAIRAGTAVGKEKKNEKIILEHTSANPDGPLHIGHLRNAVIGDALVRVLKRAGYEVETQYYLNDMGRQIAVVVWGAAVSYTHLTLPTIYSV